MKIENLISDLKNDDQLNEALDLLKEIIVEKNESLIEQLNVLILHPEKVKNTNRFAAILVELNSEKFVENLILKIQEGKPGETGWLADYMYALGRVLDEMDDYQIADDAFVEKLIYWLFNTAGGEISWKSGIILSNLENDKVLECLEKAVKDPSLFFLGRLECLERIVDTYGAEKIEFCKELLKDEEEDFTNRVKEIIKWLEIKKAHNV